MTAADTPERVDPTIYFTRQVPTWTRRAHPALIPRARQPLAAAPTVADVTASGLPTPSNEAP